MSNREMPQGNEVGSPATLYRLAVLGIVDLDDFAESQGGAPGENDTGSTGVVTALEDWRRQHSEVVASARGIALSMQTGEVKQLPLTEPGLDAVEDCMNDAMRRISASRG